MRGVWTASVLLVAVAAVPARASDTPRYEGAPTWVKPAPDPDPAAAPAGTPMLIVDSQQRIEDGGLSTYTRMAMAIANPAMLNENGNVRVEWHPDHGDLIVHHARLLRGTERIDLIAGGARFDVLKRELGMEQRMLTGILTAVLEMEGARVGDIVDIAYSVTTRDPVLKGQAIATMPLFTRPAIAGFARHRISWSKRDAVKLRGYLDGLALEPRLVGEHYEVELTQPIAKPADVPTDAPLRYRPMPFIEASTFADWAAVSRVFAPLYATTGAIPPGSPLAAEVARIRAAGRTPRERIALALESVQGNVRYLFRGMAGGNFTPQPAARTWELRYGDCKAKTLLLLAMLRALDVEAEPVLASISAGDVVPKRLPSAAAFDHVFVRAWVDGQSLWLDGTGQGSRLADLDDAVPFRWVLPVRAAGGALEMIAPRANARPNMIVAIDYDQRAGIGFPTPFTMTLTMRGEGAEMMRLAQSSATKEQRGQFAQMMAGRFVQNSRVIAERLTFDEPNNTGSIVIEGVAQAGWTYANGRRRREVDLIVRDLNFTPDRSRAAWKTIPVATEAPQSVVVRTRLLLPAGATGYTLEGDRTLPPTLVGRQVSRTTSFADGVLEVEDRVDATGAEVTPEALPAARAAVAAARGRRLTLIAPASLPPIHVQRRAAVSDGRIKPLLALYDRGVATAEADDPSALENRASFREAIEDRAGALADIEKALAIEDTTERQRTRYRLLRELNRDAEALKVAEAIHAGSADLDNTRFYALALAEAGQYDDALALVEPGIEAGGPGRIISLQTKSEILARRGDAAEAVAALDVAITERRNDPDLFNERCWIRATLNVALDEAMTDCDRSIALGIDTASALDSRAMVHLRANRLDRALADLDEALAISPIQAPSLYLRGIVRLRRGDRTGGEADIVAARYHEPRVSEQYDRWGIKP